MINCSQSINVDPRQKANLLISVSSLCTFMEDISLIECVVDIDDEIISERVRATVVLYSLIKKTENNRKENN